MTSPITGQTANTRIGLCPHGLVPSACPICSSSLGSGGGKLKIHDSVTKTNSEWSWLKCYAQGLAIKARQASIENYKSDFERQIEFAHQMRINLINLTEKIKIMFQNIQETFPPILKPVIQTVFNIAVNMIKIAELLPKIIELTVKFEQNLRTLINNAYEKIAAIFGDMKNFIKRKIQEGIKKIAKNFFMFFSSNIEDENYKNDDNLLVFKSRELKKFVIKIFTKKGNSKKNAD